MPADEIDKKLTFPMKFASKCPVCGCTEGIVTEYRKSLKQSDKSADGNPLPKLILQAVFPPASLLTQRDFPVLVASAEVCANPDCHTIYCTGIVEGKMVMPRG